MKQMKEMRRMIDKIKKYPDICRNPVDSCDDKSLYRSTCHNYYNQNTELPCRKGLVSGCREYDKPNTSNPDLITICNHNIEQNNRSQTNNFSSIYNSPSKSYSRSKSRKRFNEMLVNLGYISSSPRKLGGKNSKSKKHTKKLKKNKSKKYKKK